MVTAGRLAVTFFPRGRACWTQSPPTGTWTTLFLQATLPTTHTSFPFSRPRLLQAPRPSKGIRDPRALVPLWSLPVLAVRTASYKTRWLPPLNTGFQKGGSVPLDSVGHGHCAHTSQTNVFALGTIWNTRCVWTCRRSPAGCGRDLEYKFSQGVPSLGCSAKESRRRGTEIRRRPFPPIAHQNSPCGLTSRPPCRFT